MARPFDVPADAKQGIMQTKTQFTFYAYGWTSAEVSFSVIRFTAVLILPSSGPSCRSHPHAERSLFSCLFQVFMSSMSFGLRPDLLSHHTLSQTDVRSPTACVIYPRTRLFGLI